MGFLRDLFGAKDVEVATLPAPTVGYRDHINLSVVGESHYQDTLRSICKRKRGEKVDIDGKLARLIPEPDNPHDPNAIAIQIDGQLVGYLSRGNAKMYGKRIRQMIEDGESPIVFAWLGCEGPGAQNPNIGVRLRVPLDSRLAKAAPRK